MEDSQALKSAIDLAFSVEGRTSPRPPVGAVVVQHGEIVGKGATTPPFGPHAEVLALQEAGEAARGATLYVSLEPCCITSHTPPCTDAIKKSGIKKVVAAALDPNPKVCGRGIAILQEAGIEVEVSGQEEVERLIKPFGKYINEGRPYVTAKWAMTLDGKLATLTGDSHWISNEMSRLWVHDFRDRVDAILIGAGTARADNPRLTVRIPSGKQISERTHRINDPLRVILSSDGQLPEHLQVLQPDLAAGTCIVVSDTCSNIQMERLARSGAGIITVPAVSNGQVNLRAALEALAQKRGLMHVLIEGGAEVLGAAFDLQCIDHVAVFIAPKLVGGSQALSPIGGAGLGAMAEAKTLQNVNIKQIGEDILFEGDLAYDSAVRSYAPANRKAVSLA